MNINPATRLLTSLLTVAMCACGGSGDGPATDGDTIAMQYASNLSIVDYDGYSVATLRNPWDTTRTLQTVVMVPDSLGLPATLPRGTVVRTPLRRTVVYTSVHAGLIDELGRIDAIAGVCDAPYIRNAVVNARIQDGAIADCGGSMAPNIERIVMLSPDALLVSAYQDSGDHNKVAQTGVPIIDCADYMETSPLGRAEWVKLFGRLYGCVAAADSMFEATVSEYNDIKARMAQVDGRPMVLTEKIYGQSWGVPGANSTMGIMIEDAGGRNPFDTYSQSGSVMLAPEQVLYTAGEADIWLVKYAQDNAMTLAQLGADNKVYTQFAPYRSGRVYGCNTQYVPYFDQVQFHPQWLLAEMAALIHPESGIEPPHHYYTLLER